MSHPSTTLATTARSPQTLRSTTSTSGMRWLHHCTSRSEKQMRACCKLITLMKNACYQVEEPIAWLSQQRKSSIEFAQNSEVWFWNWMLLHVSSVFLSSLLLFFFFWVVSLTVANSPVGSVACASTSLMVLAAVDSGTNSCRGPFLHSCR